MRRLRIAMLGAGHVHAPSYLRHLAARGDVELVGIYDPEEATARSRAEASGVAVLSSAEECLERCEAAVVCCEPTRQLGLVAAAAACGRPVLCEKPLGTTLDEARSLRELARASAISVALPVRYHPAAAQLRAAVRCGALGTTAGVWATNRNSFPGGWFADPALAGGGCLLDHLVHVADLLRWVWGTELVSASAEAGVLHRPGLPVEDTAVVLVQCANGMIATIDPSMSRPRGMPGALDLTMKVWAEHGTAEVDIFASRVESVDEQGSLRRHLVGADMDAAMIGDWVRSLLGHRPAPVSAEDAFAATCLSFAAQQSAREHTAVELPG
jgi:myo-inositol 2-dehydrogenase/D-chiro-inositol 1-dehydrogenase